VGTVKKQSINSWKKNETIDFYIAKDFWASRSRPAEHDEGILKEAQLPGSCLEAHRATS
jgi:hypothetical protein